MPASDMADPPRQAGDDDREGGHEEEALSGEARTGMEFGLGLIDRLRSLDPQRVFWEPVVGVTGYAEKIKHPMSFRVMENKMRAREYLTWRALLADFDLICSNAKTFNSANSTIWKLAGQLHRSGRKLLQGDELAVRRALYALHPEGSRAGAAAEETLVLADSEELARGSNLYITTGSSGGGAQPDGGAAAAANGSAAGEKPAGAAAAAPAGEEDAEGPLPTPPGEDAAVSARLWEVEAELPQPNDWGLLFRDAPEASIDCVTQAARLAALYLPYGGKGGAAVAAPGQPQQQQQQQQAAAAAAAGPDPAIKQEQQPNGTDAAAGPSSSAARRQEPRLAPSGRTAEWRAARRPLEWRARWLELRMRELREVISQIKGAPCDATRSGSAATAAAAAAAASTAAAAGGSAGGAAPTAAAAVTPAAAAAAGGSSAGGASGSGSGADVQAPLVLAQRGGMLLPSHLAAFTGPALLAAPFFALHAAPPSLEQAVSQQQHKQPDKQQQQEPDSASPEAPPPAGFEPTGYGTGPAEVFGSLELIEKHLAEARLRLAAAYGIEVSAAPAGIRLGPLAASKLMGHRRGGGGVGAGGGEGGKLARDGSGSFKRRRMGSSIDDEFLLSPTAAPKILERPVINIHIPRVRELPADQLRARRVAMTAWNAAYSQHGAAALGRPPPDVSRAFADLLESSGDEASGDEHYATLHAVMAAEEAQRLSGFAGTGAQRGRTQNKTQQQQQDGGGGGGGGSVGGPPEKRGAAEKRGAPPKPPSKPSLRGGSAADLPPQPPQRRGSDSGAASDGGGAADAAAVAASGTPTLVRRATASGPGSGGLRRTSSGGGGPLTPRSGQQGDAAGEDAKPQRSGSGSAGTRATRAR